MSAIVERGTLYVVATPIGNLGDLTFRGREVLSGADVIFAEDTRVTAVLLAHYGIATPLVSLHEHNEARRSAQVVEQLRAGRAAALVTDAGTPALSDPGARLVRAVRQSGFPIVAIPGPSAVTAALSVSGVEGPFAFLGFLPSRSSARRTALSPWAAAGAALVMYESPHRVRETVGDLLEVFGPDRHVIIARELTKKFETIERVALGEASQWFAADANRERGEFVLILEPPASAPSAAADAEQKILHALLEELPLAQAVRLAQRITGVRRNTLYEQALAWTRSRE